MIAKPPKDRSDPEQAIPPRGMTYKACASSYIVFSVICGSLFLLGVAGIVISGNPTLWQPIAICLAAWAFAILWVSRYRLEITADSVAYSSLFSPERRVSRSEIVSADFADQTSPYESPLVFVVRTASGIELRVNSKVFSLEAVRALMDLAPMSK